MSFVKNQLRRDKESLIFLCYRAFIIGPSWIFHFWWAQFRAEGSCGRMLSLYRSYSGFCTREGSRNMWMWKSQCLKVTQHQHHPVNCRHLWEQLKLVYMEKIKENKQLQLDGVLPTAVLENTLTEHQQTAEEHFLFLWETPETSVKSPSASVTQQDGLWNEARSWSREPTLLQKQTKKRSSLLYGSSCVGFSCFLGADGISILHTESFQEWCGAAAFHRADFI